IDSEKLMEIITKQDSLVELYYRPGGYLAEGVEIGVLYTHGKWEEDTTRHMLNQFVIGKTKTAQQDLEFSIFQMVEIAARALSPGVNDPFTAMSCIDNLTAALVKLTTVKFPSRYRFDADKNLRTIADILDFEGVLDASFNQLRQFSGGSPAVIIRLMEALTTLYRMANKEDHKKAVIKHAHMVLNLGRQSLKEENDLADLVRRAGSLLPSDP